MTKDDYRNLREAYIFLRNLENRVQISFGLQTHLLPEDEARLAILALKMGIEEISQEKLAEKLLFEFVRHTQFVGGLFSGLFEEDKKKEAEKIAERKFSLTRELSAEVLADIPFKDRENALRFLKSFRDGPQFSHPSEKSIKDFYEVLPKILEGCGKVPLPDSAVKNLVKFIEPAVRGNRSQFIQSNEKLLELLLINF